LETALEKAITLILTGNQELGNILLVTAKMSFSSSLIALLLGVPLGILLGTSRFRGKNAIIILNRTFMSMPPVVCGLILYMLFSGVGPFRGMKLLFTVPIMIIAQVLLITPLVINMLESYVSAIYQQVKETAKGLRLSRGKTLILLANECVYPIFSTYLLAFARAVAEVGSVSMVGGAIAWKTNVMTTAIMQYTNRGDFSLGIALGIILMSISLLINIMISLLQRRLSR